MDATVADPEPPVVLGQECVGDALQLPCRHRRDVTLHHDVDGLGADRHDSVRLGSNQPAGSVFLRDGDEVYHTYSAFERDTELLNGTLVYLDLTPNGRQVAWDLPGGRGEAAASGWWRPHDQHFASIFRANVDRPVDGLVR